MMMKSVFWWRKPEYPEETTDLRQVTDETFHNEGFTNEGCPPTLSTHSMATFIFQEEIFL